MVRESADGAAGASLLPEVREDQVSGDLSDLYEELRNTLPARTINLIYRHLATIPEALPWVVTIAREISAESFLDEAARSLSTASVPVLQATAEHFWSDRVVAEGERRSALEILKAYNASNPRNLVMINVMAGCLKQAGRSSSDSDQPHGRAEARTAGVPPRPVATLDPPSDPNALPADILQLAEAMCTQMGIDSQLLPSLHRHLGRMPNLYRALAVRTEEAVFGGEVANHAKRWQAKAADLAAAAPASWPGRLPEPSRIQIRRAIHLFEPAISSHCVLGSLWEECVGSPRLS